MKRLLPIFFIALAVTLTGCSSKSKKNEPEPMELERFRAEVKLKKEWSRGVGDGQGKLWNNLTPAVDGDQIFAADIHGRVRAFERFTGKRQWQNKLDLRVSGGVGAAHGQVFLGTLDGDVIALDARNGTELWRAKVSREVLAAPASNGQIVVVQTLDDTLIGLDASNGQQRWIYENSTPLLTLRGTSAPLITPYVVYAGLSSGKVIAIELEYGMPVWEQRVAVPAGRTELERMVDIDGQLLLKDSVLYVAAYQGRVAGLDEKTGQILWQRDASSYVGVAQSYGQTFVSLETGVLESVDERSGARVWSNEQMLLRQLSGPTVFSSYVAVADLEGYLHLLSQVDGRFVARTRIDRKGVRVQPLVVGGWMYVYGNDGKLIALTIR